ncbi:MAG TPA: sulfatase [Streptosporangiales bacterium]
MPRAATRAPSILLVVADQLRGRDLRAMGNAQVRTPNIDGLASRGVLASHCYANTPVCCPNRATLFSGLYPMRHTVIGNDLPVPDDVRFVSEPLRDAGYRTGYIGKWHLDGVPRDKFTPPGPRRHGFEFWAAYNCSHDYFRPRYYRDTDQVVLATGYEPEVQTGLAVDFLAELDDTDPFFLVISWGPPHDPYDQVPERFRRDYRAAEVGVPPNVPADRDRLAGTVRDYYAAITALDEQVGRLMRALRALRRDDDTLTVFTSDHGDMLGAHGWMNKQLPHEEAVHVPLVACWPDGLPAGVVRDGLLSSVDLAPTLLGMVGVPSPGAVDGCDRSGLLRDSGAGAEHVFLHNMTRFDESIRSGKPEWRGIRSGRWTYAETVGRRPWLLFDNHADPWQLHNLIDDAATTSSRQRLAAILNEHLLSTRDPFLDTPRMIEHLDLLDAWNDRERALRPV